MSGWTWFPASGRLGTCVCEGLTVTSEVTQRQAARGEGSLGGQLPVAVAGGQGRGARGARGHPQHPLPRPATEARHGAQVIPCPPTLLPEPARPSLHPSGLMCGQGRRPRVPPQCRAAPCPEPPEWQGPRGRPGVFGPCPATQEHLDTPSLPSHRLGDPWTEATAPPSHPASGHGPRRARRCGEQGRRVCWTLSSGRGAGRPQSEPRPPGLGPAGSPGLGHRPAAGSRLARPPANLWRPGCCLRWSRAARVLGPTHSRGAGGHWMACWSRAGDGASVSVVGAGGATDGRRGHGSEGGVQLSGVSAGGLEEWELRGW